MREDKYRHMNELYENGIANEYDNITKLKNAIKQKEK